MSNHRQSSLSSIISIGKSRYSRGDAFPMQTKIHRVNNTSYFPVLYFILLKAPSVGEEKGKYFAFELKTRSGTAFRCYQV
jgi:hypothetical protein